MAGAAQLTEARCGCHKLLLKVSSTSNARMEVKCPRCSTLVELRVDGSVTVTRAA